MGDEIELVSDGDGIAVFGEQAAVERFLGSKGLQSRPLDTKRLHPLASRASGVAANLSALTGESGRWVKLTEESAQMKKAYGLMPTKKGGISHAMIGDPGRIEKWIQIEDGPIAMLTNPTILSGAAGIMAQAAMEQAVDEIIDYLKTIDAKVDDVIRAQKDSALAKMIGVDVAIEEAMTIRDHVGHVTEVTWSKVQGGAMILAETQAYAIRQLDGLADKLEATARVGDLSKIASTAEVEVQDWLAVLARTVQLQEAYSVLELDRVFETDPDELDSHRLGLQRARANRREQIAGTTEKLLTRMAETAQKANSKVLFNPIESPAIVASTNQVSSEVVVFQGHLGIDRASAEFDARQWSEAATEAKDKALEVGAEGLDAAKRFGSRSLDRAASLTSRFANRVADRANRRIDSVDRSETEGDDPAG